MLDSLGDRQKKYENAFRIYLPERIPVILRADGKGFHQYVKGCKKPFDQSLIDCMNDTAKYLCQNVQNVVLSYIQSDEISLLLYLKNIDSQSWFDNNLIKMCSVTAGMASAYFTSISDKIFGKTKLAVFDCRGFVVPKEDVNNAFLWRQQDCTRNSVQMLARSLYSHNECNNKNVSQLQEMCFQKGINWNDLPISQKRGRCIVKAKSIKPAINLKTGEEVICDRFEWQVDNEIPIFSQNKDYINKRLET